MNDDVYESAQQGNPEAQYQLGERYAHFELVFDVYVQKDYKEAKKWYKKAAEQNHVEAQYKLGKLMSIGEEAVKWYRKAAEQNHAESQYQLGNRFGIEEGAEEAVKWYRKAAEQNHDEALVSLAWMYKRGRGGVPQDYKEAVKLYWKATDLGNDEACFCLARLYKNGLGVPKDEKIARELERKANILYRQTCARMSARRRQPKPQPSTFPKDNNWVHTAQIVFATLVVVGVLMQCAG